MRSPGRAERVLLAVSVAVAVFAVVARVHNATAYPAMRDWDAGGHALNVVALREGHLPLLRSWAGSHPPLYYAVGAALWTLLPEGVPVHVVLRLLSSGAWLVTIALVWRSLRRLGFRVDAAIVAVLLLGVPGIVIASGMMGNDAFCVLLMTATLVRLLEASPADVASARHVAGTALLAGLAALTKAPGLAVVGVTAAYYAWESRRSLARAVRNAAIVGLVAGIVIVPHYGRLSLTRAASSDHAATPKSSYHVPPYDFLAGFSASPEKEAISLVVLAVLSATEPHPQRAALLQKGLWGDPTSVFLPPSRSGSLDLLSSAGLLVDGLVLLGMVRLLWRRDIAARARVVVGFGLVYLGAIIVPCIVAPYLILTKTNFLLPLVLPVSLVLSLALEGLRGHVKTALRGALLAIASAGVALTWYGWWEPAASVATERGSVTSPEPYDGAGESPDRAVARYFDYRARDPIRALPVLTPEFQLAHGLRLVAILRVPFPEQPVASEEERALELARARQAWLDLYNLIPWLQPIAAALQVTVLDVDRQQDSAEVRVRIGGTGATPPREAAEVEPWPFPEFEQRFRLVRTGADWRITGVTQSGVALASAVPAFVANPTLAGLDHLRALGWRPNWEAGVSAATRTP